MLRQDGFSAFNSPRNGRSLLAMVRINTSACLPFLCLLVAATAGGCAGAPLPEEDAESPDEEEREPSDGSPGPNKPASKPSSSSPSSEPEPVDDQESALENDSPFAAIDPDHIPEFDPDFPGIDHALTPDIAVPGCTDGYDEELAELVLRLDSDAYGVRLHGQDGTLYANDRPCTNGEDPLDLEALNRLRVVGGAERNVVILDLSKGSFGERLFAREGGFYFDVGQGLDHVLVRGTREPDDFYVGASPQRLMMALSSVARINVWVKQAEGVSVGLGPGDDGLQDIGRLNVGLYDIDSGAVLRVEPVNIPMRIFGGEGADVLRGGRLDDHLDGGPGNDTISALAGNDFVDEGESMSGADVVNGGEGLDTLSYRSRTEAVMVLLCSLDEVDDGCPTATCTCASTSGEADESDTLLNIESVRAGSGDDVLIGTDGDDYLYGGDGNDTIEGGDGSDVLQGGAGMDHLRGGEDADICDQEPGEDVEACEI